MQLWSLNPRFYIIQDTSIKSKSCTYVKSIAPYRQTFAHVFSVWMLWDDALRCELCWIWARGCCCCCWWWCCRARAALAHSSSKLFPVYSKLVIYQTQIHKNKALLQQHTGAMSLKRDRWGAWRLCSLQNGRWHQSHIERPIRPIFICSTISLALLST